MDSIKVAAKTVEEALTEASIQLGTSSDNIEYTVLDEGAKGLLFGLGGRDAVIEAKRKVTDEDLMKEIFDEEPKKENTKPKPAPVKEKKETEEREVKPAKETKEQKEPKAQKEPREPKEPKDRKEPRDQKESKDQKEPKNQKEPKDQKESKEPREAREPRTPKMPADPEEAKRRAITFIKDVLEAMGMPSEVTAEFEDTTLCVNIEGENMGILIGKRGQTLDSLQYLTSLVVNKGKSSYVRLKLDTEDYRARRKATLENLARNIAVKVKKTRRPVFLEPMNPYERRIIHSALQNDPYVTTHSEGEEPYRKVVVTLKKDHDHDRGHDRHSQGGYNRYSDHKSDLYETGQSEIETEQSAFAEAAAQTDQDNNDDQ